MWSIGSGDLEKQRKIFGNIDAIGTRSAMILNVHRSTITAPPFHVASPAGDSNAVSIGEARFDHESRTPILCRRVICFSASSDLGQRAKPQ
jgi:hypothetical protein